MGILSELIIGNEGDGERILAAPQPSETFESIDLGGLTTIEMETLKLIIEGTSLDEFVGDFDDEVLDGGEDGPWVLALPLDFVNDLATLEANRVTNVATQWAATEELEGTTPAILREQIAAMVTHAKRAVELKKRLFLWFSL